MKLPKAQAVLSKWVVMVVEQSMADPWVYSS